MLCNPITPHQSWPGPDCNSISLLAKMFGALIGAVLPVVSVLTLVSGDLYGVLRLHCSGVASANPQFEYSYMHKKLSEGGSRGCVWACVGVNGS